MQNGIHPETTPPAELTGRRVDLLITELYVGGAEKCITDLSRFLKSREVLVRVISLASLPSSPHDALIKRIREAGIEVHSLGSDRVWNAVGAVLKLRGLLQKSPPDVLQSFLFHANVVASAALLGMRRRVPARQPRSVARPIRWVAGVRVADPRPQRLAMEGIAFRNADRVVAVSEGARLAYRAYSPIDSQRWLVIPNGIEVKQEAKSEASWQSLGLPSGAKVMLFVGRLDAQKGVTWLIETASDWLCALPKHHLVIAGRGDQQALLEEKLTDLFAAQPELKERIHLIGWLDRPRQWMQIAEAILLPAQYEGMPNVCLEAMAESRPVIAFDVQGIRELLGQPGDGQVVGVSERSQWTDAIKNIALNPQLCQELGARNRSKIEAEFRLASQLEKYLQLYVELLS
jgi:glycosyltransferase involved in cell wall biosynthesis